MSSHHFVREGQEPALLIETEDISKFSFLDQITGWNPVIIAMERSVPSLILNTVHFDHLISIEGAERWQDVVTALPYLRVHHAQDQNIKSILEKIIETASCKELYILCDEPLSLGQLQSVYDGLGITVFTPVQKWIHVVDKSFKSWFPAGSRILFKGTDIFLDGREAPPVCNLDMDQLITVESTNNFWIGSDL